MQPELPIMNWLLSDPSSYRVWHGQQLYIIKWRQDTSDWPWQALKVQISYMKKWPKYPQSPFCYAASSLPACIYGFMGSSLLSMEGRLGPGLQMVLHDMQASHNSPSLGHSWRTVVKGNPHSRQDFKQCISWLHTVITSCEYIVTLWLHTDSGAMAVWLDSQGLGRNVIGKSVTRKSGEEVCG